MSSLKKHGPTSVTSSRNPSPILEAPEEEELFAELNVVPLTDVQLLSPEPLWKVWTKRIKGLGKLFRERKLLPDYFHRHPNATYFLIGGLVLIIVAPIKIHIWLFLLGLIIGYIASAPLVENGPNSKKESTLLNLILAPLKVREKTEREFARLSISPAIDAELDFFLNSLLREVIDFWYVPLCLSGELDFQSCVRSTINAAIMNLIKFASSGSKDTITLILYGITNALIVHMEEFRLFEESRLPLDRFLASGRTRRVHHRTFSEDLEHVRQVIALLLKKLLPRNESRSILVNSLLREIISSSLLAGIIEKITEPDFINEQIVKAFGDNNEILPKLTLGWSIICFKGRTTKSRLVSLLNLIFFCSAWWKIFKLGR